MSNGIPQKEDQLSLFGPQEDVQEALYAFLDKAVFKVRPAGRSHRTAPRSRHSVAGGADFRGNGDAFAEEDDKQALTRVYQGDSPSERRPIGSGFGSQPLPLFPEL